MDGKVSKTPNQILAEEIVSALKEAGVLSESSVKSFEKKISEGQIKESDWKVELTTGLKKEDGK